MRDIGSVGSGRWDKIIFRVIRRGYRTEDKLFCPECPCEGDVSVRFGADA
jgi:hypothetical protein